MLTIRYVLLLFSILVGAESRLFILLLKSPTAVKITITSYLSEPNMATATAFLNIINSKDIAIVVNKTKKSAVEQILFLYRESSLSKYSRNKASYIPHNETAPAKDIIVVLKSFMPKYSEFG